MVYVLERIYGIPKTRVREMIESILTLPVELENLDIVLIALSLYEEKNLKFGDALLLATAKVKDIIPIYTFDTDFKKFREAKVI